MRITMDTGSLRGLSPRRQERGWSVLLAPQSENACVVRAGSLVDCLTTIAVLLRG